jgi:hypothetical protein
MQGTHKANAGFVEVEYIGEEKREDIPCPSGRIYILGTDEKHKKAWIHSLDLNYLKLLGAIP